MNKTALHVGLFLLTMITTSLVGAEYMYANSFVLSDQPLGWPHFLGGLHYSLPLMGALLSHEFGHYFMALYYKVKVSLPYCIPFWIPGLPQIGTFGAVIRIESPLPSRRALFDVGVAGPLAGFAVGLGVLCYALLHLPPAEYIFSIHSDWEKYGLDYASHVYKEVGPQPMLGTNLLMELLKSLLIEDMSRFPNQYEALHYPYLLAGYLVCFFTALNLLPVGQLDGGHLVFGLFGRKVHQVVSVSVFIALIFFGGLGSYSLFDDTETLLFGMPLYFMFLYFVLQKLHPDKLWIAVIALSILLVQFVVKSYFPYVSGFPGWLVFAFILGRGVGIAYPPVADNSPLDFKRKLIGWISLIIFILCFAPVPFDVK